MSHRRPQSLAPLTVAGLVGAALAAPASTAAAADAGRTYYVSNPASGAISSSFV